MLLTRDPSEILVVRADVDSGAGVTKHTGAMIVSILKVDVAIKRLDAVRKVHYREQF